MFDLNNDDMDQLFREAAENYPLRTEGAADWNRVLSSHKSDAGADLTNVTQFKKEKKRRVIFWWLLLLPLGWIGHYSYEGQSGNGIINKFKTETEQGVIITANNAPERNQQGNTGTISDPKPSEKNLYESRFVTEPGSKQTKFKTAFLKKPVNNAAENETIIADSSNSENIKNAGTSRGTNMKGLNQEELKEDKTEKKNTDSPSQSKNAEQPPLSAVKLKKDSHFYAALMAGADLSTIKFQPTKGVGYSIGILIGYHLSKSRFGIETGLFWDKKNYFSNGEYVDRSKMPAYFQNDELQYVDGNCNMFEIPVNLRYNLIQKRATTYFGIIGLSSYLMNKEVYGYQIKYPNGYQDYDQYSYYHSTQNLFSILNLSLGYEHRLGKIGDIRIEPYAKLPIAGVGKLNLSIMSGGLNVGLSKRF
jgi:hypothetical protein